MSVLEFIEQRKTDTEGQISVSAKRIITKKIEQVKTFVDCNSCEYFRGGLCEYQGNIPVPPEMIQYGCGSGDYLPF